jgi:hypothetical protein
VARVQSVVREMIVPGATDRVQIMADTLAATFATDVRSRTAEELIDRISLYPQHPDNRLIVSHEAQCSISELSEWWDANEHGGSSVEKLKPKPLTREVKRHLESAGLHWRVHAQTEIRKFEGPCSGLDAWLQQFGELDCSTIGRKIAAKLRVISTGAFMRGAFAVRGVDLIGHRSANCYVQDDDPGGSWVEMQAILNHACQPGTVFPVHWDKDEERMTFPDVPVDEFVIYEDGLWSGNEAMRRMLAIKAASPAAPVKLRFGVVTDFGLMVLRQTIRSHGLNGRVSIDTSTPEYLRFLKADLPEPLRNGLGMEPDGYFDELHAHVEPFAFMSVADWTWTPAEIEVCERIGAQLVERWISKRTGRPAPTDKVALFALGGGRFASTVLFSRSVPKVCLPLLWLDGPVDIGGKSVTWRPLFVDARRVSEEGLLLAAGASEVRLP